MVLKIDIVPSPSVGREITAVRPCRSPRRCDEDRRAALFAYHRVYHRSPYGTRRAMPPHCGALPLAGRVLSHTAAVIIIITVMIIIIIITRFMARVQRMPHAQQSPPFVRCGSRAAKSRPYNRNPLFRTDPGGVPCESVGARRPQKARRLSADRSHRSPRTRESVVVVRKARERVAVFPLPDGRTTTHTRTHTHARPTRYHPSSLFTTRSSVCVRTSCLTGRVWPTSTDEPQRPRRFVTTFRPVGFDSITTKVTQ